MVSNLTSLVADGKRGVNVLAGAIDKALSDLEWSKVAPGVDGEWMPGPTSWKVYVVRGHSEGLVLKVDAFDNEAQEYRLAVQAKTLNEDMATHRKMYEAAQKLSAILNGVGYYS